MTERRLPSLGALALAALVTATGPASAQDATPAAPAPAAPAATPEPAGVSEQLNQELAGLRAQVQALETERGSLQQQLASAEQAAQREQQARTEAASAAASASQSLQAERDQLAGELRTARDGLAAAQSQLQEKTRATEAAAAASQSLQAEHDQLADELRTARDGLAAVQGQLQEKVQAVEAAGAASQSLQAERDQIAGELRTARDEVAATQARLASETQESDTLAASSQALEKERAKDQAALAQAREIAAAHEQDAEMLQDKLAAANVARDRLFGALREALGPNSSAVIIDERFVFPSDVGFASASAVLKPEARARVVEIGRVLAEATADLPADTRWVLRIDGHTDPTSVGGKVFTSNRALSQARSLNIVNALVEGGLPQSRLAAGGFGEYRPLVDGETPEANQRNRRVELVVTPD